MENYYIEDIYNAIKIISSYRKKSSKILVAIKNSFGKISYEDIYSPADYPSWRKARMDGFACNSKISDFSKPFSVVADVSASDVYDYKLNANECIRIATGAKISDDIDVVIRLEDTNMVNDVLYLNKFSDNNSYIEDVGARIKKGDLVLKSGDKIDYRHIELLATLRINNIYINYIPKIGILSTGGEITDRFSCETSTINSNFYGISSLLDAYNIPYVNLGICEDDENKLKEVIIDNIDNCDAIISFGGTAYSRYDLMESVIKNIDGKIIIDGLKSNPGKTFRFGILKNKPIFIFPGNPQAAIICAEIFLLSWILSTLNKEHNIVKTKVKFSVKKRAGFYKLIPTLTKIEDGILCSYDRDSSNCEISNAFRSIVIIPENIVSEHEGNYFETFLIYYM